MFTALVVLAFILAVAPDKHTLAATRGAVGAYRGVRAYGRGEPIARTRTSAKSAKGGRSGSTSKSSQPSSIFAAARAGWREGVEHAKQKRAAGRDLVGRVNRITGWSANRAGRVKVGGGSLLAVIPQIRKARADRQARLDAAMARLTTQDPALPTSDKPTADERFRDLRDNQGYKGPIDQDGHAVADDRLPFNTDTKEKDMSTPTTELDSIDQFAAEGAKGKQMAANIAEAIAAYAAWSTSLADRASKAKVMTGPIRAAVATIAESAGKTYDPETATAGCDALVASCVQAKSAAEPLAELKAEGDVRAYQPA